MIDCRYKYEIILERAKKGIGKFEDGQFLTDKRSLGDELSSISGIQWKRISEEPDAD